MARRAKLVLLKDRNGNVTYGISGKIASEQHVDTTLAASVAQSTNVPDWAKLALMTYSVGTNVYMNSETAATLPGAGFANSTNDLNPILRSFNAGDTLSFISDTPAFVSITFFEEEVKT